jgi:hypothetical protein
VAGRKCDGDAAGAAEPYLVEGALVTPLPGPKGHFDSPRYHGDNDEDDAYSPQAEQWHRTVSPNAAPGGVNKDTEG